MKPTLIKLAAVVLAVATVAPALGQGLRRHEEVAAELKPTEQKILDRLDALNRESLDRIEEVAAPDRLEQQVEEILSAGSLAVGARPVDSEGLAPIHRYIAERIEQANERLRRRHAEALRADGFDPDDPDAPEPAGLIEDVATLKGLVAANVPLDKLRENPTERSATLEADGTSWDLTPLWPNGAMPSITPADGLTGPLVYIRKGAWKDIRGLQLNGAIAVMDFGGGRNWERVFGLGCKAIIVVEDEFVNRSNATGLAMNTPVPCPRFYVDRETGQEIVARATRKNYSSNAAAEVVPGSGEATVSGGTIYEQREWTSPFYYVPPTDPVSYTVQTNDLTSRIADSYQVAVSDLRELNGLDPGARPEAGQELTIPGLVNDGEAVTYEVRENDLLRRIASDYDVSIDALQKVNDITTAPQPGETLTIPNIDDTLAVLLPIDSVSIVSDAPAGADVQQTPGLKIAGNVAAALTLLDYMTQEDTVRRKGLLVGFLDAETIGGMSSRAFGQYVLMHRGKWTSNLTEEQDPTKRIGRYRDAAEFLENLEEGEFEEDSVGQWFVQEWLEVRAEDSRVTLHQRSIDIKKRRNELNNKIDETTDALRNARREGDEQLVREFEPRLERYKQEIEQVNARAEKRLPVLDRKLKALYAHRNATLDADGSWSQRARRFLQGLPENEAAEEGTDFELNQQELRDRLLAELTEEET
ncbi:MAG: LysM peptidoglycan-binding domain-containing protein, partial [Planctomycetota bacterium]